MKNADPILAADFARKVADLYRDMENAYAETAKALGFSCAGCPDNCCDSYFLHHTYTEWAYLWQGLRTLDADRLEQVTEKAAIHVIEAEAFLARGERPSIMCPLNAAGLCTLYPFRMMICRLHGVPAVFTRPDGKKLSFPGCFRCQENVSANNQITMDRTEFFRRMVNLELELLGPGRRTAPKVGMTIAQMIVKGPPVL